MNVFHCLSCQHSSFPVTREMVRLKPCALCVSEVKYACQCCINHQRRWAKGQIQSHQDQWTFFSPSNPMSFGSGPGGCQTSANPTEKLLSKCWCAVWQATAVRLADVSFMERILVLMSRISHWDSAQGNSCSLHRGKAGPTLPVVAVCEGILFLQTHSEAHQQAVSPGTAWGAALSSSSFTAQQTMTGRI